LELDENKVLHNIDDCVINSHHEQLIKSTGFSINLPEEQYLYVLKRGKNIYDDFDIVDFYFNKESAIEYCDKIVKNYEIENTPIKVCVVKCIPGNDSNGSRYIETIHFSSHHAHIIDDELY
jgi:hypothetical protein